MEMRVSDISNATAYISSITVALGGNILQALNDNAPACGVLIAAATFLSNRHFQRKRGIGAQSDRKCEYISTSPKKEPFMIKDYVLPLSILAALVFFINDALARNDRQIKALQEQSSSYTKSLERISAMDAVTDKELAMNIKALSEELKSKK